MKMAKNSGFSLVEIVLAMLVIAVGALAVFSLFPEGLKMGRVSNTQANAANIAATIFSDIQAKGHENFASIATGYSYSNATMGISIADGLTNIVTISTNYPANNDYRVYLEIDDTVDLGKLADVMITVLPGVFGTNEAYVFVGQVVNFQ